MSERGSAKPLPLREDQIRAAAAEFETPFHLYHEAGIRRAARSLSAAFAWAPGFREYFAVKATPTPAILALLAEEGCGLDCSSLVELVLAERAGVRGDRVMFSSNNTPIEEYRAARRLGALINFDDVGHLDDLARRGELPETVCFRYNPGPLREGNAIIGRPEEAKFGCTRDQIMAGYAAARAAGVAEFGLHTMVASNELDPAYFVATARMLFELAAEVQREAGVRISFVNLGGGVGIPYRPGQAPVDLDRVSAGVRAAYAELVEPAGLHPMRVMLECGRVITGPSGMLVTRVRHLKETYRRYIGVDATMADLMRPGMYGAYHHIDILGPSADAPRERYDVVGSLCENNDKFAVDRSLPRPAVGDLLVIHDTGAHGRAMGFNYNGKLRCAEVLLREDGSLKLIRRAETIDDYLATLIF
jgi:diaminopimelate decarboxylase